MFRLMDQCLQMVQVQIRAGLGTNVGGSADRSPVKTDGTRNSGHMGKERDDDF